MYNKKIWAWAFYDWANSAFAAVVIAGFFPIFFKEYWAEGLGTNTSTFYLGLANSLSSLTIVLIAPTLGAIADQGGMRKRFLVFFAFLGVVCTAGLSLMGSGQWWPAMLLYIFALVGFMGGNVFYDAMLLNVAERSQYDRVSSLGYALGYIGGGLVLALSVSMSLKPAWFGFADAAIASRWAFILTAVWWLLFSMPLMLYLKDRSGASLSIVEASRSGVRQLWQTLKHLRQYKPVLLFLLAYWLYIDGVDTIITMAVDYGLALGFASKQLIVALLLTQFIGFPATLLIGYIAGYIGVKRGIYLCILAYMSITIWGYYMDQVWEFYSLAAVVGLFQGGVQALSRSYYARMIPKAYAAEFFGFYNMLGKFAAVLGPVMMGWVSLYSGNTRLSILALLVFFILGLLLLAKVKTSDANEG